LTSRFISNVAAASLSACQQADSLAMSPLSSCLDDEMDDKQEDG